MGQCWAYCHGHMLSRQLIRNQMSLCHMFQCDVKSELFCNTQGCKYIISLMCMSLQRYLFLQNRDQRFQFQVKLRLLLNVIPCGLLFLHIGLCLKQLISEKSRSCHPGGIPLILITIFRIFSKCALHCNRVFHHHFVDPAAHSLHCRKGSPQYIRTARAGSDASYPCFSCMFEAWIKGVDSVDGTKLRCDQIVKLTVIPALITDPVTVQTCVAVCLHKPRIDLHSFGVDHLCSLRDFQIRTNPTDLSVLDQNIPLKRLFFCHCVNQTIFNA